MYPQALPTQAQIRIDRLEMMETGTYNDMFCRPINVNPNGDHMANLVSRVEQSTTSSVSPSLLTGLAGSIMQPMAEPEHQLNINNGWSNRRIRFALYVTIMGSTGTPAEYIFQGFTSHLGVYGAQGASNLNYNGQASFDPNMEFYINSFMRMNTRMVPGPTGQVPERYMTESAHILNGQIVQDPTVNNGFTMRPTDLFTGVQSQYLESAWNGYGSGTLNDTRVRMDGDSFTSKRANCLPSNYLSKVITSYQEAKDLLSFGQDSDDLYTRARDLSFEPPPSENPFVRQISFVRGMPNQTKFTIANLTTIDPTIAGGKMTFRSLGQAINQNMHMAGRTEYWHVNSNEAVWATMLGNAVPALMMELMIGEIAFFATNDTINGQISTQLGKSKVLTSNLAAKNLSLFVQRLEREVLADLAYKGFRFQINVSVNVFSESKVDIKLDHGPMTPFCVPSFCDSLMAPVFTSVQSTYVDMVNKCEQLVNELPVMNSLSVNSLV